MQRIKDLSQLGAAWEKADSGELPILDLESTRGDEVTDPVERKAVEDACIRVLKSGRGLLPVDSSVFNFDGVIQQRVDMPFEAFLDLVFIGLRGLEKANELDLAERDLLDKLSRYGGLLLLERVFVQLELLKYAHCYR